MVAGINIHAEYALLIQVFGQLAALWTLKYTVLLALLALAWLV